MSDDIQFRLAYAVPKAPPKIVDKFYDFCGDSTAIPMDKATAEARKQAWQDDVKAWPEFHRCGKERKPREKKERDSPSPPQSQEEVEEQIKIKKAITRYHYRIKECVENNKYDKLGEIVDKMDVAVRMLNREE